MPWFINFPYVVPIVDVWSDGENLAVYFEFPRPVINDDEVAVFKGMAACLLSLRSRHLALAPASIGAGTFCGNGDGLQKCTLSPYCEVIQDPDGRFLYQNMGKMADLGLLKYERSREALRNTRNLDEILRHPATWGDIENMSFIFHYMAFCGKSYLSLNTLIRTEKDGLRNWAVHPLVVLDIEEGAGDATYDGGLFWDLVRYIRNKFAHFYDSDKRFTGHFRSPEGLLRYFNDNVVEGGDLVHSVWSTINQNVESLSRFWVG